MNNQLILLGVNIDHIATLRQARGTRYPEPVQGALIAEQAGGKASDGFRRTMEIQPESLHQRTPFIVGSKHMVEKAEYFMSYFSKDFDTRK